ncbi:sulfur carrier protein ThiS adenylyltransferase ThiF [Peptacetobacter hiranonis]|uniref:sulfur carrier protein ThiS adenylyltransferase ThiF n=1 Tax=Peptacetobacter hiranonis TaxID=89152 RepID=UPI0019171291|nr:sulfur carrier protein ThiS adenylyltransferase ThiF [Peptacetobacter hiranonis]QQQ87513.1 sulfur carrier protein ThiS adenylyltransferase ThiF [Peptacetobacter hiranonis]
MDIFLNEKKISAKEGITAKELRNEYNENCDVIIVNGYPIDDKVLKENDRVVLIQKGKKPTLEEFEALLTARHTPNVHQALKKGRVAILGLGGLGSNIASSLARIGVGKLILADFDVVEPSNLNRQNYFINDIGKLKTEATKENIERINPFVDITLVNEKISKENMELFSEADIIVEAFDNPNCKAEISNYVLIHMRDKYLVASSGMAGYYDSNIIQTKKIRDKFYICGDFVNEAKEGDGLMAPRVSICANHMANKVVQILVDGE